MIVEKPSRVVRLLSVLVLAATGACTRAPEPRMKAEPSATQAELDSAAPVSDVAAADAVANANAWREFARKDDVPVCLFTTWDDWKAAAYLHQVAPNVTLRANHAMNFGVFAPGCSSAACVRDQTLQCWVDVAHKVITLHTRYSGFEKPGRVCTSDCISAAAQCNTPLLAKGTYEVVHGAEKWTVRVPSVRKDPCLKR